VTDEKLLMGEEAVDNVEEDEKTDCHGAPSLSLPRKQKSTLIHNFSLCDDPDTSIESRFAYASW
jgi:hypothetical protein